MQPEPEPGTLNPNLTYSYHLWQCSCSKNRWTPLMDAVKNKNKKCSLEVVKLLAQGKDVNDANQVTLVC